MEIDGTNGRHRKAWCVFVQLLLLMVFDELIEKKTASSRESHCSLGIDFISSWLLARFFLKAKTFGSAVSALDHLERLLDTLS